jgi:uncharacterized protein (DUF2267 family)
MQYTEFIKTVQRNGQFASTVEVEHAARTTLEVLSERLQGGEAQDLYAQLPPELVQALRPLNTTESLPFGLHDFYKRVSEREGTDLDTARNHAHAVVTALRDATSAGELQDILSQLPNEFDELFGVPRVGSMNDRGREQGGASA